MTAITRRRLQVLEALRRAFPDATWTLSRASIRGVAGFAVVSVDVSDLYGERGCSEVTVHPRGKSPTWDVTGRSTPRTRDPRSIVAATRRALQQTMDLGRVVRGAWEFTNGIPF